MKETYSDYTITYPDLAFTFNPITIKVEGIKEQSLIGIIANEYNIYKEADSSTIYFDLSAIAKSLFDRRDFHVIKEKDDVLYKTIEFNLVVKNGVILSRKIPVVWGALQIGETYSQHKKLTYFKDYPFTIPMYITEKLDLYIDGIKFKTLDKGKYNLDIDDLPSFKNITLYNTEMRSIFDFTFDSTFQPEPILIPQGIEVDINTDTCFTNGVYLRWINKHGEYNYYLFQELTTTNEIKNIDVKFDSNYRYMDYVDNYHQGQGKSIGKTTIQTKKLFASLVDSPTYNFLIAMLESPVVDMLAGYDKDNIPNWQGVNLEDGTFSETTSTLKDLEFNLITNNGITQTL